MSEIFLINEGETLVPLAQKAYNSEDLLQTLLEKYPSLLAGDQVNPTAPRRWLLVKREAAVPRLRVATICLCLQAGGV